ncbi:MAG: hypothetical protein ABSF27_09505 [Candidatus Dormibacteria bacterium]
MASIASNNCGALDFDDGVGGKVLMAGGCRDYLPRLRRWALAGTLLPRHSVKS